MEMMRSSAVRISDGSQIAEARRAAVQHARELDWNEVASGQAALIATELATNLARHASDGVLILNSSEARDRTQLQVISIDRGPGMQDIERCFKDGFTTTASSRGTGLGAVRRIARSMEVFSSPGKGTVLVAELEQLREPERGRGEAFAVGGISVQRSGESVCGDAWYARGLDGALAILVVDGLGHGPLAAAAAQAAVAAFRSAPLPELKHTMTRLHEALKPTRGAAAAVALIDPGAGALRYCGVGNIVAAIVDGDEKHNLVSHNGTLGHTVSTLHEFSYPWTAGALLAMHSDGLSGRWRGDEWPGLWLRAPALGAGVLYRDWQRGTDDAAVVVVRTA
jgi:anti-sigma regulatory factor (Ser/Thr protein kinase)